MSDFWPQTLKNIFFFSEWYFKEYQLLLLMVRNNYKNLKRFLYNTSELVTWYIVGIPTKTNFEHFISLLLIIGRLFRAMAQMKACNILDTHQNQNFWVKSAKNLT